MVKFYLGLTYKARKVLFIAVDHAWPFIGGNKLGMCKQNLSNQWQLYMLFRDDTCSLRSNSFHEKISSKVFYVTVEVNYMSTPAVVRSANMIKFTIRVLYGAL